MSAKNITQIAVVMGNCTAGGAYIPAMSDETIIVQNQGTIFLAGPPLVKAATGEDVCAEELGGGDVHTRISGVADYLAKNDDEALELARNILAQQPQFKDGSQRRSSLYSQHASTPPLYDPADLLGIIPADQRRPFNINEIIARLVDGSDFHEFKPRYGKTLVCGYAKLDGFDVGILANNGILFNESALKATHFIQLCDKQSRPLIFLQNITGFMVGKKVEHQGIAKDGAKMVTAVATTKVPKFSVVIGGSYGAGNYAMCGRAYDPRMMFTWPTARMSVMGGEQAAKVLLQVKLAQLKKANKTINQKDMDTMQQSIIDSYNKEASPYYGTARLFDDGLISPLDTRHHLSQCLSACQYGEWNSMDGFGLFRM